MAKRQTALDKAVTRIDRKIEILYAARAELLAEPRPVAAPKTRKPTAVLKPVLTSSEA